MKTRWTLAALACGALALGLLAPGAVGAAPSAEKPSGKAIVRIDGGTAYAKKKAKGSYRVVVPDGAQIDWMGEVTGKGVRSGSFTPKALVAGWVSLGDAAHLDPERHAAYSRIAAARSRLLDAPLRTVFDEMHALRGA